MSQSQLAEFKGKLDLSGELGEKCQEQATAFEREAHANKGASEALGRAASHIHKQLVAVLEKEWEDGEFSECTEPEEARGKVKKYISRAVGFLENLGAMAKNAELVNSGKAKATQDISNLLGRHNDAAAARIRQLLAPPEPESQDADLDGKGNPRRRPGERPVTEEEQAEVKAKAGKEKAGKKKAGKKKSGKKRGRPRKVRDE